MTPLRRLAGAASALLLIVVIGTAGFCVIEKMSLLDALYMTVITVSTVGYREVGTLSTSGRVFTLALIVSGVGTFFYLFSTLTAVVVEGQLRDVFGRNAMERSIERLSGHVIVCGYGRFGRVVAEELIRNGVSVLAMDRDPEKEAELLRSGVPFLLGSGLDGEVLERAGIRRARAIVAATASDPDNVFITLSAREKNPNIRIHARGESDGGLRHLKLAGAHQVLSAYHSGGMRVAAAILRPSVVDFLELSAVAGAAGVALEEVRIDASSALVGRKLTDVEHEVTPLRVVAVQHDGDAMRLVPRLDTAVQALDLLVVVGERAALEQLARLATAPVPGDDSGRRTA